MHLLASNFWVDVGLVLQPTGQAIAIYLLMVVAAPIRRWG